MSGAMARALTDGPETMARRAADAGAFDAGVGRNAPPHIHDILDAVGQGLGAFDADLRLTLANRRFLDLFDLPDEAAARGRTLASLVRAATRAGVAARERGAWRRCAEAFAHGAPFDVCQALRGGQAVAIAFRPVAGGGWAASCADVARQRRLEQELTQQVTRFEQALGNMAHGLAMYGADERLIVCNRRYLDTFDLDPAVVVPGVSLRDVIRHSLARGLYAGVSEEALYRDARERLFSGGEREFVRRAADGRCIATRSRPMVGGGWVVTCEDVTARENAAASLQEQHDRFSAALDNMSQGLCMFDAGQRLIICNDRYIDLFHGDREVVRPGATLHEIFAHGVSEGLYPGMTAEALVARRLDTVAGRAPSAYDQSMADGRMIGISIRAMTNGGWIGTFEDVTDMRRAEAERAAALAALRDQNLMLDATIESMAQGLCVYDRDFRVVVRNRRYLELYGLDEEDAQPGVAMIDLMRRSVAKGVHAPGRSVEDIHAEFVEKLIEGKAQILHRRLADGRVVAVRNRPMANGGWVATFEDITERERAADELREQHRRFDAALNNMPHGLCMLDAQLNVIVCNQRYLDLYGLEPDAAPPGINMLDLLEHSRRIGNYTQEAADRIREEFALLPAVSGHVAQRHLNDGRVIEVVYQPMPLGGWVATHEDVTERRKAEQRIAHLAHHDALTGLPNRMLFREKMAEGLARVRIDGRSLAIFCVDLDHFKGVNDTLGHPVGDRLLRSVSERLVSAVDGRDAVARLGGDEFAILIEADRAAAEALAQRLVAMMAEPIVIDGQVINSGLSIGVALAPVDADNADDLMKCADLALYRAKSDGRNMCRFYERVMSARIEARRALELDLRQALSAGELHLVYQPQVKAATQMLTGFEALMRWTHPIRGAVSPAEFIPLAEETGLIHTFGEWALRQACLEATRWPHPIRVAVNLSPAQFKSRGLTATVMNALAASGLSPRRLELEITEALLLGNDDATLATLHELRGLGVRISMDDFGIGYSSLSYLRSFPFDKIKIDRSFVSDLSRNADSAAIIRAVASLGASLDIETTAEGVETDAQLDIIRACGCTEAQGYLISRPQPANRLGELIAKLCGARAAA
jgi:diguanylate cyclase (GGDEF)-like protein/PAS domain S-box-containing protein